MGGHRLSFLFARRYLSSRKSLSVINIISRVSIFAVGVPVAAMVILMSVFNGFEGLIHGMYTHFDPDIRVAPAKGKVFDISGFEAMGVRDIAGVEEVSYYLEENVMFEYNNRQAMGILRGVDSLYERVVPIRSLMIQGGYELRFGDMEQAVIGQGVAYTLGVRTALYNTLNVHVPRRGSFSPLLPMEAYSTGKLFPAGIFALDMETDGAFVLSTIEFAQELFDYPGMATAAAIKLSPGAGMEAVRKEINDRTGDEFKAATRYEQKASMYKIMKYEKWAIFFISFLVLIIASFSIIGSLVMLIIDKRPDIATIFTIGGNVRFARRIFTYEGLLIGALGVIIGVVCGVLLCWLQQHFGFIKMGGTSFLVDAYPVEMRLTDILLVTVATLGVTWVIAWFTSARMIRKKAIRQ